jgi:cell division protease FtsH
MTGVILLGATNRPEVLDPALLRPGRFDRQVLVDRPDRSGRLEILKVHVAKIRLVSGVDLDQVAGLTAGFTGADLANLVNEAALRAARVGKRLVTMADFEYAKDKVLMGTERRSMAMTDEEKKLTAYHEAGHALVAMHVPKSDPLHKVTIIPRGRALGVTMQLPERDHLSHTKQFLESRLAIMFGGRIAEEIIFGPENVTTGAASDIQVATQTARGMITAFGMSEKLGRVRYQANEQEVFLGHAVTQTQNVSEATAQIIDQEVRRLIEEAEGKAKQILTDRLDELHLIAKALLEYETLSNDEISTILRGEKVVRDDTGGAGPADRRRRASVPTSSGQGTGPAPGANPEPQPGV